MCAGNISGSLNSMGGFDAFDENELEQELSELLFDKEVITEVIFCVFLHFFISKLTNNLFAEDEEIHCIQHIAAIAVIGRGGCTSNNSCGTKPNTTENRDVCLMAIKILEL